MTLRRKLILSNVALLLGLTLVVAAALWGLTRQRAAVDASLKEINAIKLVQHAQLNTLSVRNRLRDIAASQARSIQELRDASSAMDKYLMALIIYAPVPTISSADRADADGRSRAIIAKFQLLASQLDGWPAAPSVSDRLAATKAADDLVEQLSQLLVLCNGMVAATQSSADSDLYAATVTVGSLAAAILLLAVGLSVWQYRRIMLPLEGLREWSRRLARGDFEMPFTPAGDREFVQLGQDLNGMARQLGAFYRQLEEMVAAKSKELVRSERLASVGYLAAGVAHEINSPLNVISGYAELSLKRLGRRADPAVLKQATDAIEMIRKEAFRCKQITERLLSLARNGSDHRELCSLARIADDVAIMVRGLKNFQDRQLVLELDDSGPLWVLANPTEMKQVLLNLAVNALEAVESGKGRVGISGRLDGQTVSLSVSDNGRGMTAETLDRVFEPFFTDKRGSGEPGTGLGLSITHAIITDHGGQIRAASEGPGLGSRFTISLPAREAIAGSSPSSSAGPDVRAQGAWKRPAAAESQDQSVPS